ncbi:unnamed protein product, partial [Leptidea sinapis]
MVFGDGCKRHMLRLAIVATCLLAQVVAPGGLEPCSGKWPQIDLQHLDISMSYLEVITESSLDGLRNFISHIGTEIRWHYMEDTLTSLSLSNNQISQLNSRAFTSLNHLLQLDLEGNYLTTITSDSLPSSLTVLKVSNNFLYELSCDLVQNLPRLQILHIRHNLISFELNDTCVSNKMKKLEKIDLSNNKINGYKDVFLFREVQVRQIILDLNELTFVPKFLVSNNRIERVSLSYNKLSTVAREIFIALKNSLEHLEIEHNKLSYLPDSLAQVLRLRHLSLAYNQLEESPQLPSRIQTLSLAGNFLTSMPSALQALEPGSIRYLDLSYNRISNLFSHEFRDWSTSLGTINLKGNRIAQIYDSVFPVHMPVKEINLSFNDLYYVHPQSFSNLSGTLHVLESSSTLFSGYFPFEINEGLESLSWLSFDNNDFHILRIAELAAFPYLKYLNLDYNRIVEIVVDEYYTNITLSLTNIRLSYNFLSCLRKTTFERIPELTNLDLSHNRISNLTKHTFANLSNLRYLSLADNVIDSVETGTFSNLPKLEILELQNNNLTYLNLNALQNVSISNINLSINVSNNKIKYIDGNSLISINIFDGSYNDFHEVPTAFFIAVEYTIRQVILSHNKIAHITNEAFGQSILLEILDLHKNSISIIKRKSFLDLISLQILDLSYNSITQLAVEQFHNLKKLRYLKLDHNNIRLLPRDIFKNTIIEHLDLSYNGISLFPVTALSQIGFTLRHLDFTGNKLEYLDGNIFRNTQFLSSLSLGSNLLTVLSDNTFSSLSGLRRLDLSFNFIKANFKELFHNLPNLRHLNLANISLKSVPYLPLTNLTSLNLTSNYINSFKETDVKRLLNLRHLDISHNRLTSLVPKMWVHLKNLIVLDISYNPIVRITPNSFKGLGKLSHLNINGLKYLDIVDQDSFRPLTSLRFLHIQTWSSINHASFRITHITSSLPSLYKLVIHFKDRTLKNQLHGIDARKIRYLEIKGSNLERISEDAFEPFANSQEIFVKITETSISKLPATFMKHLGQIPQLGIDISYNQIARLNPAIFYPNFTSWSHVATKLLSGGLIMTGNPLRCECDLAWLGAWLRRWLQENDAGNELRRAMRSATCRDQLGRHLPLLQLRADEAECHASALSSDAQPNFINFVYTITYSIWEK